MAPALPGCLVLAWFSSGPMGVVRPEGSPAGLAALLAASAVMFAQAVWMGAAIRTRLLGGAGSSRLFPSSRPLSVFLSEAGPLRGMPGRIIPAREVSA